MTESTDWWCYNHVAFLLISLTDCMLWLDFGASIYDVYMTGPKVELLI